MALKIYDQRGHKDALGGKWVCFKHKQPFAFCSRPALVVNATPKMVRIKVASGETVVQPTTNLMFVADTEAEARAAYDAGMELFYAQNKEVDAIRATYDKRMVHLAAKLTGLSL